MMQDNRSLAPTLCALILASSCVTPDETPQRAVDDPGSFVSDWPEGIERTYPGPDYFGNRLYDWRIRDGRLECLEGSKAKPMRTLHLLTRACAEHTGTLRTSVRCGPIATGPRHAETWVGFLIGVGGDHVDFRTSALCHHWPAADGGLIAALDGTGRLVFRDNTNPDAPKGPRRGIPASAWPLLDSRPAEAVGSVPAGAVELRLAADPVGDAYRLTLSAHDPATGALRARSVLDTVDAAMVSGNLALVSHQSPSQRGTGYWFDDWTVSGSKVAHLPQRAFGPVVSTQYTLSEGTLTLTAQMAALGNDDTRTARLEIADDAGWRTLAHGEIDPHSATVRFRLDNWDAGVARRYRVAYDLRGSGGSLRTGFWGGTIRADPAAADTFKVAAFTGHHISAAGKGDWNNTSFWYPHADLTRAVAHHDPDLLFFSGDQIYEGGLAGIVRDPPEKACLDYLYHWYRWCWAFRDLTRDRPTVAIPDDHDVYHGNIWGAGGIRAQGERRPLSDNGGYIMDPLFVNAVHRTQVSNLPAPWDPTPIEQGISVYYTDLQYGGLSFAVIADRMWKSSPSVMVPQARIVNGWFQNPDFDPRDADVPGAELLGPRQLQFLRHWAADWGRDVEMKVLLSQTIFANVATIPATSNSDAVVPRMRQAAPGEYIRTDKLAADADSNGWPQSGRNAALREIRRAFAFHIAGDQHLGSFVQYGVDDWRDAGHAFCVPSIANVWPRRWFPPRPGLRREPGAPEYTGDFEDGFGNKVTVHAVSNPTVTGIEPAALHDRAPGYGIVVFDKRRRTIEAQCWPRWANPADDDTQYAGWPITVAQRAAHQTAGAVPLPTFEVLGDRRPLVQVVDEATGELVYTWRSPAARFCPPDVRPGVYSVWIGEIDDPGRRQISGLRAGAAAAPRIEVDLR